MATGRSWSLSLVQDSKGDLHRWKFRSMPVGDGEHRVEALDLQSLMSENVYEPYPLLICTIGWSIGGLREVVHRVGFCHVELLISFRTSRLSRSPAVLTHAFELPVLLSDLDQTLLGCGHRPYRTRPNSRDWRSVLFVLVDM